ncbi:hypothetical protein ACFU7T_05665 [Streptomyces sp. NPDC057555]|uniref:hypothetical protein n=1 Tax=Streptomyces sp. NPDC057555 TaxID=3346166 RepID=UPI0036B4163E
MYDMSEPVARPRTERFISARLMPLLLCLLTAFGAGGVAVFGVAPEERRERQWQAATPCPTAAPVDVRADCLTTLHGVIERLETHHRSRSYDLRLHFRDSKPVKWLDVEYEADAYFAVGDRIAVTWWRGEAMRITNRQHTTDLLSVPHPVDVAVVTTLALLIINGLLIVKLGNSRRRGKPIGSGPTEPDGLAFLRPVAATAAWTVPMAGLRPSPVIAEPVAAVCTLAVLWLTLLAWRKSGHTGPVEPRPLPEGEDLFLRAHFLEDTPYNPHLMGTHIVLGAGPMAVVPHGGPGRLAAKQIPAGRLTVQGVRGPTASEEYVSSHWYVADLLDDDVPVRLTAAPADLLLLVQELERAKSGNTNPSSTPPGTTPPPNDTATPTA